MKKILWISATILWLLLIFWFSGTTGKGSDSQSKGFTYVVVKAKETIAYRLKMTPEPPTEEQIAKKVYAINPMMRKIAHGVVYFVLAIFILLAITALQKGESKNFLKNMAITLVLCFLYALTDEYHQTFVKGRTGEFIDCIIDTGGAFLGCLAFLLWLKIKNQWIQQNSKRK